MTSKAFVVDIPISESVYLYANEYIKSKLDKISRDHFISYQFKPDDSHWLLELIGNEQDVSESVSEVADLCDFLTSNIRENAFELPISTDIEAFKRIVDVRFTQRLQVFVLPNNEYSLRIIGPRDKLVETKEKMLDLAAELGLPNYVYHSYDSDNTVFLTSCGTKVSIIKGDLVLQQIGAIVNPANEHLQHCGGAAKTISDAAGAQLIQECQAFIRDHGSLRVTEVMHTSSGNLFPGIVYVIHTVGPRSDRYPDPRDQLRLLEETFLNCLLYADSVMKISSLAVPAISSGIFGISKDLVAEAAFSGLRRFETEHHERKLRTINFVNIDDSTTYAFLEVFLRELSMITSTKDQGGDPLHLKDSQSNLKENTTDGWEVAGDVQFGWDASGDQSMFAGDDAVLGNPGAEATAALEDMGLLCAVASHKDDRASGKEAPMEEEEKEVCVICMEQLLNPKELLCGHKFCVVCINDSFEKCQPSCPSCGELYSVMRGNQPPGKMKVSILPQSLPGYEKCQTLLIEYNIPNGTQDNTHPNPGQPYYGTYRKAYLPNNREGEELCDLLQKAFAARLVFTVGRSDITGLDNQVIWNDIHHKTKFTGQHGYPDEAYLVRLKEELRAKGIIPLKNAAAM